MKCHYKTSEHTRKESFIKESFIKKSNKIHNNKYDYTNVNYDGCRVPVEIICPIHGSFIQKPCIHVEGAGCQKCSGGGFQRNDKIGYFYINKIMNNGNDIAYKFGITHNITNRIKRQHKHTNYKIENIFKFKSTGYDVSELERYLKENISTSFLSKDVFHDGYTETISPDDINKLEDLIIEYLII